MLHVKKLLFTLLFVLVLIVPTEAFAKSSKFRFLSDSTRSLNSLRFFCIQTESPVDTGASEYLKDTNLRLKDPNKALLYAIFPGFFVHGTGHFYAGKTKTGLLLLGTELVGIGFVVKGIVMSFAEMEEERPGEPGIPLAIGYILFCGSWFYDLIGSPLEIKKRNEELLRSRNIDIEFEIKQTHYCLKLVKKF